MSVTLITYGPHNAPNQFYTASGRLSEYGLACGYVERHTTGAVDTELYREHNCYHVRTFDGDKRPTRVAWSVADTLTEAHKHYRNHLRTYHKPSPR
jgi:hypothetical protein